MTGDSEVAMDVEAAAQRWADVWQRGWERRDTDPIVRSTRTMPATRQSPFRMPFRGRAGVRAYLAGAFADEDDVRAWFSRPIVTGSRAAVQWWAALTEEGKGVTLAGTSILTFDADGLVVDQWDTWNTIDDRRKPPEGWGH